MKTPALGAALLGGCVAVGLLGVWGAGVAGFFVAVRLAVVGVSFGSN